MKNLNKVYAFVSLIFLAVLAISPAKDYFSEWRGFQNTYNELLSAQPRRIKPVEVGIKQLWNEDLDRVDRCTSCHLGLQQPGLIDAKEPFKEHPRVYHDIDEFGCTVCHEGQGLATTSEKAHDGRPFWEEPMLPRDNLEASCGKCHKQEQAPRAPILSRGRRLIRESNCAGCHKIDDIPINYAPSLDGIGSKTSRDWLVRWLKDPKAFRPETKMPDFKLSDEEASLLADFLMSFKEFPGNVQLEPIPAQFKEEYPPEDWVDEGKTIFRTARCISCHLVEGKGGPLAPDLAKISTKARAEWLYSYIRHPKLLQPGVQMPAYGFTPSQARKVTAYMVSEFVDWDAPEETAKHTPDPAFYKKGLKIFNHYNCGGCHHLPGIGKAENMGPDLTDMGDRHLYQLEFGSSGIEESLPSYIYNKLKSPRDFVASGRMPVYGFSEDELVAISTALLAQTTKPVPLKYMAVQKPRSAYAPQGEFGRIVDKYSCFSCHVINGRGFLLATDLTREGSQVNARWLKDYFKIPYSMRPVLTERMPNLYLSDKEISTITNYFDLALRDDAIDSVRVSTASKALISQGKTLFFEKYGCQACHQVGGKGGYVGPPLDRTGSRLTPGWIYSWIMNPRKYYPHSIEPAAGVTDKEAWAITAFLTNLRGE